MPSRATYPCTTFAPFLAARTAADLSFTTKIAVDLKSWAADEEAEAAAPAPVAEAAAPAPVAAAGPPPPAAATELDELDELDIIPTFTPVFFSPEAKATPTKPILHAYNSPANLYSLKAIVFPV